MVNGYLTSGDLAPQILFYNGPGATPYTTARDALYNWSATPTFQIDGVSQQLGWSQTNVQNYINARLAVPSYVDIDVTMVGNASGGTAYYTITVEQATGVTGPFKLWSAIVESNEIASSSYGVYAGQELMWEPRAMPMGEAGTVIEITGPYPQVINMSGPYTLDPVAHTFTNLDVITYVQASTGTHEVLNASFVDLPDTASGIEGPGGDVVGESSVLTTWPNPSSGQLSVGALLPAGVTGTITVFDLAGRSITSFDAAGATSLQIDAPGVYLARLETSSGEVLSSRFTVIR